MLQKHCMRKRTQSRSASRTRNRQRSAQRLHYPPQNIPAASAKLSLPCPQARMRLRMPHRKKFKFQRQQSQSPVLCNLRVMLAQSAQTLLRIVVPLQQLIHLGNPPLHRLLKQGKKNIFLALEVCVEGPPRVPSPRRNILQTRRLIPIARKRLLHRLLKQGKKNIFLALEVCVEGPPRVPSPRRNILQTRRLIPIARKRLLR